MAASTDSITVTATGYKSKTVVATSLASIAHDIGSEPIALKLALTAYLVALAIFIPVFTVLSLAFLRKQEK